MSRKLFANLTLLIFLFCLSVSSVFAADVVINEAFANPENEDNEFIELYNTSDSEIDLSSWKITDKVKSYPITDQKIAGKGFLVLKKSTTTLQLNNTDEEIKLKNSSDQDIDTFSYSDTISNKSWSRVPDGTGSFVNNTNVTEGTANSAPPPTIRRPRQIALLQQIRPLLQKFLLPPKLQHPSLQPKLRLQRFRQLQKL